MKKLTELYKEAPSDVMIKGIKINSKECEKGDLFVCTMGVNKDRHEFIEDAVAHGAVALVVGREDVTSSVPMVYVENPNRELPYLCSKFYDHPENKMKIIGVTGTDGKTSVASIVQTLIGSDLCGYIGTNGRSCASFQKDDNPNTTPDSHLLYSFLDDFVKSGCKYTVMETSSEAFYRGRLTEMQFDISIFTNITSEHLNIHKTFENYVDSKCQLFAQTKKDGFCILNKDDPYYQKVYTSCNGKVLTYGRENADLEIVKFTVSPNKTFITLKYQEQIYDIESPLLGDFNVSNLCAALLACLALGMPMDSLIKNIKNLKIRGRLEMLKLDTSYYVMVDYAHTPNGITKLLQFVHSLDINRSIVVIGSAGERDYLKRPVMGEVVLKNATYAIFTSEDPRSEDPKDIADQLVANVKDTYINYEIVLNRREAIEKAISMAKDKDIILILGKGCETYQKLKNETIYFNDLEEAYNAVAKKEAKEKVS